MPTKKFGCPTHPPPRKRHGKDIFFEKGRQNTKWAHGDESWKHQIQKLHKQQNCCHYQLRIDFQGTNTLNGYTTHNCYI